MKNLFDSSHVKSTLSRINNLSSSAHPEWGKMNVAQMLAHCCVAYEMVYDDIHPAPSTFKRFMLKTFVKNTVVGPKPYKKNSPTAPQFKMTGAKDFEREKRRLVEYIQRTQKLGSSHFENKENLSFGPMSSAEWNVMFSKHLDHHLTQFKV